jgi:hypothetical protein
MSSSRVMSMDPFCYRQFVDPKNPGYIDMDMEEFTRHVNFLYEQQVQRLFFCDESYRDLARRSIETWICSVLQAFLC